MLATLNTMENSQNKTSHMIRKKIFIPISIFICSIIANMSLILNELKFGQFINGFFPCDSSNYSSFPCY